MKKSSAFSLIELSIVILIIGILVAGITQSSRLVSEMKLSSARAITQSSNVSSIKDLSLWLEATSDKSFTSDRLDDSTAISQWNDINPQISAGLKSNALQATSGKQPLYIRSAINGLPAIKFDGTNDYMSVADGFDDDSQSITVFVVWKSISLPGVDAALLEKWDGGSSGYPYCLRISPTIFYIASYDGSTAVSSSSTTAPTIGVARIVSAKIANGDALTIWTNGSQEDSDSDSVTGTTSNGTALFIGARGDESIYANGYFGEIIVFSRALKAEERQSVEKYLGQKWGINVR